MKYISDEDYNRLMLLADTLPSIKGEIQNMFHDISELDDNHNTMEDVYNRLMLKMNTMSKEDIEQEWNELKKYNEIGPDAKTFFANSENHINGQNK